MEGLRRGFKTVPKITFRDFAVRQSVAVLVQLGEDLELDNTSERGLTIDGTSYGIHWAGSSPVGWSCLSSDDTRPLVLWAYQVIDLLKTAAET